ncbi:MAG: 23S rRNA (adenine(2503)-C(2))-methyltransferase RlmN [Anaerolineales bacterium]|jgi:23S rRNA (adenine2503-C2)-methyltransferase
MPQAAILDLTLEQLESTLAGWGEPPYRAQQVWHHLFSRWASSPDEMTDLPLPLRERLGRSFDFQLIRPLRESGSGDGQTLKILYGLRDGASIETVLMTYDRRQTACISTQSGCAMGCVFCATGQMGFGRNLSRGEILAQVLDLSRRLSRDERRLSNIVVMGMGEPFHNYDATLGAVDTLNHPEGMNFGARRVTLSTVGIVPGIRRLAQEGRQINLAVSLHAASDDLRSRLLPVNRRYPLDVLLRACREYVQATRRRISFEWALIRGVNDDPAQASLLAQRLRGLLCHVNLIPLNPTREYEGSPSDRETARAFLETLKAAGIPATVRLRRGLEIEAGCGQLASTRMPPEGTGADPAPAGDP